MPEAVGVIQALGFPGTLAAADAMVKAGRVTLVQFDKAERGQFLVSIRGRRSEVVPAMKAGIEAAENTFGCTIITHYTVPHPFENLEAILPIDYSEESEPYRT
ncbi:MAG: carbon dioxide-concentrating mechanism protein CcmK [Microcoleaceae cyanobacterium]